jgi:putative membrane protein
MLGLLLTALVAALHIWIMVLEMFLWTTRRGRSTFGTTPEFAASTRVLAANQGLYNGFLAAGLIWSLILGLSGEGRAIALFFLSCIAIAGLYGAATASRRILLIQTVPAVLAGVAVMAGI